MNWKNIIIQMILSALISFSACEAAQSISTKIGLTFYQSTVCAIIFAILMIWLYLLNNKLIRKSTINEIFGELDEK